VSIADSFVAPMHGQMLDWVELKSFY